MFSDIILLHGCLNTFYHTHEGPYTIFYVKLFIITREEIFGEVVEYSFLKWIL